MKIVTEGTRIIEAEIEKVWAVVSDLDGYAEHVDGLAETTVVHGSALGAVRRCIDTSGATWHETCVIWEPRSKFTIQVDVSSYPLRFRTLFSAFEGTWWVEDLNGKVVAGIRFEAELRPFAKGMRSRIEQRIARDIDAILASYDMAITGDAAGTLGACPPTRSEP